MYWFSTQQNTPNHQSPTKQVTTQAPDSDSVFTIVNCRQHDDYTVYQLRSHGIAGKFVNSYYIITVQSLCLISDWRKRSFAVWLRYPVVRLIDHSYDELL